MTTENRIVLYLRPEIQSALDAMATATRRTRSEVISSLIEQAPLVRNDRFCRVCNSAPCLPTCVLSYPVQAPQEARS